MTYTRGIVLSMPYTYKYPHPAVTADAVVFGVADGELRVLLIKRRAAPYKSCWAFPGGFVEIDEDPTAAAYRELREETGITGVDLEQVGVFGAPDRDPRERVITVAYFGLTSIANHRAREASDAKAVAWIPVNRLPRLAFDHRVILGIALRRLRQKLRQEPIGLGLLPVRFSFSEIRLLYEAVLGHVLDGKRFRKKVLRTGILVPDSQGRTRQAAGRTRLYHFVKTAYRRATKEGICPGLLETK